MSKRAIRLTEPILVFDIGDAKVAAHVLMPEALLIGGSVVLLRARYLAAVASSFADHTLPSHREIALLFAQLGADSGLIGAGLVASEA